MFAFVTLVATPMKGFETTVWLTSNNSSPSLVSPSRIMEVAQVNPSVAALDYVVETLSAMESAPFGVFPNRLTPPIPQELTTFSPHLLLIKRKVHAIAMRTFSAENAVLGLRSMDSAEEAPPPMMSSNALEDHIIEVKSTLKHLVTLHSEEKPPPSPRPESSFKCEVNSKLEQILHLALEHNVSMNTAAEDGANTLTKLEAIQEEIKDVLYEVRSFPDKTAPAARGPLDASLDIFAKSNDPDCKCANPQWCSCEGKSPNVELEKLKAEKRQDEKQLTSLKMGVNAMTSLLLDSAKGNLPSSVEHNPDEAPEVISLKSAFVALLSKVSTITSYASRAAKDVESDLAFEITEHDLSLSGIWMKLRENINTIIKLQDIQIQSLYNESELVTIVERLREICLGKLPCACDIADTDDLTIVRLKTLLNILMSDIHSFSSLLARTEDAFFVTIGEGKMVPPAIELNGVWRPMQDSLTRLSELYRSLVLEVDDQLEDLVAGNFDALNDNRTYIHPAVKSLGNKLRSYRDDYKRFTQEVSNGNLNVTMAITNRNDNAWTEMRLASTSMTQKVVRDLGTISATLAHMIRGDFQTANLPILLKSESLGSVKKLVGWVEQLIAAVRLYHRDVDVVVKAIANGKASVPALPVGPYTGDWKSSRAALNNLVARLGKTAL